MSKKAAKQEAGPAALTVEQFIQWLLEDGDDRTFYKGRDAKPMGLPEGGSPGKAWATGNTDPYHRVSLIIRESSGGGTVKPDCLIFLWSKDYPAKLKTKNYDFRFGLDGRLERAFSSVGENYKNGKPIRASAVNTVQDIEDPEIQERAQAELDFWLRRAARLIAKKKAAESKNKERKSSP